MGVGEAIEGAVDAAAAAVHAMRESLPNLRHTLETMLETGLDSHVRRGKIRSLEVRHTRSHAHTMTHVLGAMTHVRRGKIRSREVWHVSDCLPACLCVIAATVAGCHDSWAGCWQVCVSECGKMVAAPPSCCCCVCVCVPTHTHQSATHLPAVLCVCVQNALETLLRHSTLLLADMEAHCANRSDDSSEPIINKARELLQVGGGAACEPSGCH